MYFHQLNFKSQVFPGKRVVGIYGDRIVRDTDDDDYSDSTIRPIYPQLLANLRSNVAGKVAKSVWGETHMG